MRAKSILAIGLGSVAAFAQSPGTVWDGVYTQAQLNRGKAVYAEQCAKCHGAAFEGTNETPPLTGSTFLGTWQSVGDLFESIRTTMPADKPKSLNEAKTVDVIAAILDANKIPPGSVEMGAQIDALKQIRMARAATGSQLARAANTESSASPAPRLVEGKPIETRPTEKADNKPWFPEQTRAPYHASAPFKVTTLIDKMPAPWSIAFLPSGNLLLTHRLPGSIRILDKKGVLSEPVTGVAELKSPGAADIGVLDVVLDPNYATNHRIFFSFFDYADKTDSNTYLARATFNEAKRAIIDAKVIFRGLPNMPSKRLGAKTGGRIAIGRDGSLFMTLGDRSDSPPWDVGQRMDTHLGKVIHITPDGAPAPDNPFFNKPGVLPEIWAYGLRSPEGLAFDPAGNLWLNEHGPRGGDELNMIERGKNYGWPIVAHGIDYPGTPIGEGITHKDGLEEPVYYWDPVIAPSGLAYYNGNLFPQWKGSLFVGGLRAKMLVRLQLNKDNRVVAEEPMLMEVQQRIRDVRVGPEGAVYVLTDSGGSSMTYGTPLESKLLKLTPK